MYNNKTQERIDEIEDHCTNVSSSTRIYGLAMSGDLKLWLTANSENVSAAALNAAAAGTFKRTVAVKLQTDKTKEDHTWACFAPVVSSAEAVADVDVMAPTVTPAGAKFDRGRLLLTVTFDTNAGATKTYAAGGSVSVIVKVAADDKLLGYTVAGVTKIFNVVA